MLDDEKQNCSFKPTLVSKQFVKEEKYGSRPGKQSNGNIDFFQSLYDKHQEFAQRLVKKKEILDMERGQLITGKPTLIAAKSPRLAAKRRARRDELANSIGGYDSDSTLGYSSLPSSRGAGSRFRFNQPNDDDFTLSDGDSLRGFNRPNSRPSSAPSTHFGSLQMSMPSSDSKPVDVIEQPEQFSPGAMSLNEFLSPETIQFPGTARSYTGVEAPIVRLSERGVEERSTMSQSVNRRSNEFNHSPGPLSRSHSVGRSASPSSRSVASADRSIGSKSLSLFDSLYQVCYKSVELV